MTTSSSFSKYVPWSSSRLIRFRTGTSSGLAPTPSGGSSGPPVAGSYEAQKSTHRLGQPVVARWGISRSPGASPRQASSSRQARSRPWPRVTSFVTGSRRFVGSVRVVKLTTAPPEWATTTIGPQPFSTRPAIVSTSWPRMLAAWAGSCSRIRMSPNQSTRNASSWRSPTASRSPWIGSARSAAYGTSSSAPMTQATPRPSDRLRAWSRSSRSIQAQRRWSIPAAARRSCWSVSRSSSRRRVSSRERVSKPSRMPRTTRPKSSRSQAVIVARLGGWTRDAHQASVRIQRWAAAGASPVAPAGAAGMSSSISGRVAPEKSMSPETTGSGGRPWAVRHSVSTRMTGRDQSRSVSPGRCEPMPWTNTTPTVRRSWPAAARGRRTGRGGGSGGWGIPGAMIVTTASLARDRSAAHPDDRHEDRVALASLVAAE